MSRPLRRPIRFSVCLAVDESVMLKQTADADGADQAHLLRRLIRQAHAARFGSPPSVATEAR